MEPQINADERRLITSAHRNGRKDRKAQRQYFNFCMEKHPQNRTRMTWIARIFTDTLIRVIRAIRVPSRLPWLVKIAIIGLFLY